MNSLPKSSVSLGEVVDAKKILISVAVLLPLFLLLILPFTFAAGMPVGSNFMVLAIATVIIFSAMMGLAYFLLPRIKTVRQKLMVAFLIMGVGPSLMILGAGVGTISDFNQAAALIGPNNLMSLEEFVSMHGNEMFVTMSIVLVVSVIFVFILSYKISSVFSKQIGEIINMANELEKGNFSVRAKVRFGEEIGGLASTLNKLSKAVEETDKKRQELDHAKTEFISITSHELRSPMTPMKAQLQLLLENHYGPLNKKQKESVEMVLKNTTRLDNILLDFLEVSRIEAARLKFNYVKCDLNETVTKITKEMENFMPEKNISIQTDLKPLPIIQADPDRVGQVLRNLLNNAKKFSPANSSLFVATSTRENHILFSVRDTGQGISEEDQLKLFEPFFQASQTMYNKMGGTGLGLTICRGIVESQGGMMWLESKVGKGTIFYFTVPHKPTKEAMSIKLLFSKKIAIEKEVAIAFEEFLGVMGKSEFNSLLKLHQITQTPLKDYIDRLESKKIIDKEVKDQFKQRISSLFDEGEPIKAVEELGSLGLAKRKRKAKKSRLKKRGVKV